MTGRARGRARGRGRASNAGDASAPRPGGNGPPPGMPPPSAQPPQGGPPAHPTQSGGRGVVRGGGTRPGDVGAITSGMQGMGLGPRGRRRGDVIVSEPRTRPEHIKDKQGQSGNGVHIVSNYFRMQQAPDYVLYQYHVDFAPECPNPKTRVALLYQHKDLIGDVRTFDGMALILPRRLPNKVTEVYSTRTSDGENIRITIKLTCELPPDSPTCLQVYNIIFKRILRMIKMQLIGRNYFFPDQAVQIQKHRMEVWPGFVTSILQYERSILLMAEISHKILRTDTILDFMYDMHSRCRKDQFHTEAVRKIVGQIVLTRYNNKTYRIDDIDWNKTPSSTFKLRDGSDLSFQEYYKKSYDIDVRDPAQPLLITMPKEKKRGPGGQPAAAPEPIYLLPELCTVTGLSDEIRADFHIMKDLAEHTRLGPDQRNIKLHNLITKINSNPEVQKEMQGWGLKFDKELIKIQGRVISQEVIMQGGKKLQYMQKDADWSRDQRGVRMNTPVELSSWVVIFTNRDNELAQSFIQTLQRVCPPMGMNLARPQMVRINDDRNDSYLNALKETVNRGTQIVITILPSNRKDRYDAIKKYCCLDFPVPSQVVLSRTLSKQKQLMSVTTKVAVQLNCKLGGEVWAVEIPMKNIMICGIDTYHDSSKKGRSVGAFVASMNASCTRYYSKVSFQMNHMELMDNLKVSFQAALSKYHAVNGTLPERIFIYRDGVGDGQLAAVQEHEIGQIKSCFKEVGGDYNPKFGMIIVKKRIGTRFFANSGRGLSNPEPGTIIDSEVTRPEWYDFFLISQSVRQGTVSPTHYNVVCDTTGLKPDHIQRLTYKMTHLYYNWPGTVRVPAPCQYAHKLAFLVGQSLHKPPHEALSDKLYFL